LFFGITLAGSCSATLDGRYRVDPRVMVPRSNHTPLVAVRRPSSSRARPLLLARKRLTCGAQLALMAFIHFLSQYRPAAACGIPARCVFVIDDPKPCKRPRLWQLRYSQTAGECGGEHGLTTWRIADGHRGTGWLGQPPRGRGGYSAKVGVHLSNLHPRQTTTKDPRGLGRSGARGRPNLRGWRTPGRAPQATAFERPGTG